MRFHNPGTCFHRIVGLTVRWSGQCGSRISWYVYIFKHLRTGSMSRRFRNSRESDWKSNCTPWVCRPHLVGLQLR
jgi:hypothetical protein